MEVVAVDCIVAALSLVVCGMTHDDKTNFPVELTAVTDAIVDLCSAMDKEVIVDHSVLTSNTLKE